MPSQPGRARSFGGDGDLQFLKVITKRADGGVDEKRVLAVRFVPLVPGK